MAKKSKVESSKSGNWGKFGGDHKMHSFAPTGTQKPGGSSQEGHSGDRRGVAAKGGNNTAFYSSGTTNRFGAGPAQPGVSAHPGAHTTGVAAQGGKTHMFGKRGSQKAVPGQSGPNG